MKTRSLLFVLMILVMMSMVALPVFSTLRGNQIDEFMEKDPTCQKWLWMKHNTTKAFGYYDNEGKIFPMTKECNYHLFNCKTGWDAFLGNPNPDLAEFWGDSLAHTEDKEWGENKSIWKFNNDDLVGVRACTAAPLWNFKDAATLIAKTINTPQKVETLWCDGSTSYKYVPYQALWHLGAKDQADTMIKGLAIKPRAEIRCRHEHRAMFFSVAHEWKLSKEQNEAITKFCLDLFQATESHDQNTVGGCLRYLGRTKTANSDALEFIKNYIGNYDNKYEAARAAAYLPIKEKVVKDDFLKRIAQNANEKTVNKKKVTWYNTNFDVAIGVVGLYGMGDSTAEKVLKDWLGWVKADKELQNPNGFKALMREAPFVAESHRKKLAGMIASTFKEVVKVAPTKSQYPAYARLAAVALLQMGDKAGLEHVLDILKANDTNEIKELLEYLGEKPEQLHGSSYGLGGIRVGKDALTEKEARQIIDTIKARFKFWSDSNLKRSALMVALDIEARIKASK